MSWDLASVVPLAMAAVGMALMIFTIGALAGWRWASPGARHEPTWMFVTGHAAWGLFLLSMVLAPARDGWGYVPWLFGIAIAASIVSFVLQVRARAADRLRGA